jgi:pSer/pThr/pTyr-binding forkhead associated (FHA) protein
MGRGQEMTMKPEPPTRLCPHCQALVPVGFQFCGQCGGRVDQKPEVRQRAVTGGQAAGRLVLMRPDGSEGGTHPLSAGVNLVGRGSGPLFDADSYLSPLHLQIEVHEGGTFTMRDAGSLNGVFVKLTEEEPISDGAVFRIGQELLRFDEIRMPCPLEDGTEVMGSPNPGYWGRIAIIIGRAQDGSCFPLIGDAVVLGRERGDILFAEDGYVSGTHARISYRHGQVYLQDLASSNGTFLKVRGERTVRGGTFILMGQQLFRVVSG